MKTIFLSIFDGDTERVMLRTDVFKTIKASGNRIVLLIKGADRLEYYRQEFESEQVVVELLPPAGSRLETLWYYLSWNSIPTHACSVRRKREYAQNGKLLLLAVFSILGMLAYLKPWREFLRTLYYWFGEDYAADLFKKHQPDLLFAPNMFSPEDLRLLRMAKKLCVPSVSTAKSWDVLTTKAFTRVKADRLLVFNAYNRDEAIRYGDYRPERVVIAGFPQFDLYAHPETLSSRATFAERLRVDPNHQLVLFGVPGDWKSPYTKDILSALDQAIEDGAFAKPVTIIARLHPKYADSSESAGFRHVVMERPGMYFNEKKGFGIDAGVRDQFPWTFRPEDVRHLADELHHCAAIVVTDSTLALDAAAMNRSAIIIGYDGGRQVPYWKSIRSIYERDHYKNLLALGANPLVESHDALVTALKDAIENPTRLQEARDQVRDRFLFKLDGASGERMGKAVLELIS